jgi:2Fe-2S ferredoxin
MKIKFMPIDVECDVDPSKSLLEIAKSAGLKIKSICNGVPSCAECRVRIIAGDNSIPEPSKAELSLIGTSYFLDGRRLSCQVRCFGSVTVDLTEQLNKVDTQKKVRGFKQKDQKEISAVQDTMILNAVEAPTPRPADQQPKPQHHKPQNQKPNNQNNQQKQPQNQGRPGQNQRPNPNSNQRNGPQSNQGSGAKPNSNSNTNRTNTQPGDASVGDTKKPI